MCSSNGKSDDDYYYEQYHLEFFEDLEGPPLISTRSRLIAAVVQNNVEVLENLLDSPQWYNTTDGWGLSLLQIAIFCDNVEVFDYMLSIPNFPLEFENQDGATALVVSLDGFVSNDIWMKGHFSAELVKKGACIDKVCFEGNMPLHRALDRSYTRTIEALLQRGVDVNICNSDNCSPLHLATTVCDNSDIILMLLMSGAEPTIADFDNALSYVSSSHVHETLYLYLFDKFSSPKIGMDVLVNLASKNKDLFYDLIQHPVHATVDDNSRQWFVVQMLSDLHKKELKVILDRFGTLVKEYLRWPESFYEPRTIVMENLDLLLQYDADFLNVVIRLDHTSQDYFNLSASSLEDVTQKFCFFLSYNMKATVNDVVEIYKKFGYCELFKILLHMDIDDYKPKLDYRDFMPILMHNVTMDIESFFKDLGKNNNNRVEELMDYFVHPQIIKLHLARVERGAVKERENVPTIPKLIEMARNEFRKYFVKRLELKNSRQFYTLLNRLPIAEPQKRIISFEVKLY